MVRTLGRSGVHQIARRWKARGVSAAPPASSKCAGAPEALSWKPAKRNLTSSRSLGRRSRIRAGVRADRLRFGESVSGCLGADWVRHSTLAKPSAYGGVAPYRPMATNPSKRRKS
jgi:hypothetical protein